MSATEKIPQLEICYQNESIWLPVQPVKLEILGIGGLEKEARDALRYFAQQGGFFPRLVDNLIPGFSSLPSPLQEHYNQVADIEQAAEHLSEDALKKNLNIIIIPGVDAHGLAEQLNVPRLNFTIGVLCTIPEGKERKIFIVDAGKNGLETIAGILRVRLTQHKSESENNTSTQEDAKETPDEKRKGFFGRLFGKQ